MTNITPLFPDEGRGGPQEGAAPEPEPLGELNLEQTRQSCLACGGKLLDSSLYRRYQVCPVCRFHYNMPARHRVDTIADPGTFQETSRWIQSLDPLSFSPRVSYRVRLLQDQTRTGLTEAAVTGTCLVGGSPAVIIVLDFGFLGGSMGLVVGEKVALALELAARKRHPCVAVITSGGARIQEGVLSLMQMAKTAIAVNLLHSRGLPLISVLGNPATGQVLASFGSLADFIFAEPGAQMGFAPMRAVQEVAERKLAAEYTAEHYLKHGMIDAVIERQNLKHEIASVLDLLSPYYKLASSRRYRSSPSRLTPLEPWEMVQLARDPNRPRSGDYIPAVFSSFVELHGDRLHGDDPAVITGIGRLGGQSVMVLAQQKARIKADGGPSDPRGGIRPEGFRKARRAIGLAVRFKLPIITLVDTPGPQLDLDAEHRGLASSIAEMISAMANTSVATISVLIGEGGSEAALAFGVADRVLMLQNAIYSTISPEGGAEAELRDPSRAEELARALKLTSVDCLEMGIVDSIVPEPDGGAHSNFNEAARLLRQALTRELIDLQSTYSGSLVRRRQKKFRKMGEYGSRFRAALRRELRVWQSVVSAGVKAGVKASVKASVKAGAKAFRVSGQSGSDESSVDPEAEAPEDARQDGASEPPDDAAAPDRPDPGDETAAAGEEDGQTRAGDHRSS